MTKQQMVANAILSKFLNPANITAGDSIRVTEDALIESLTLCGAEVPQYPAFVMVRWPEWSPNFQARLGGKSLMLTCLNDCSVSATPTEKVTAGVAEPKVKIKATHAPAEDAIDPDYFHWPPETPMIEQAIRNRKNVFLSGPSGSGKTEMLTRLCAKIGVEYIKVNFDGEFHKEDFIGQHVLESKDGVSIMTYKDGALPTAMKKGVPMIWDETDLAPAEVLMACQSPLEGKPLYNTRVPETVYATPGFCVLATGNTVGKGDMSSLYAGTRQMNEATLNRFHYVLRIGYPPQDVERLILKKRTGCSDEFAQKVVEFMNGARRAAEAGELQAAFSLRNSQNFVNAVHTDKVSLKMAFRATILDRLSDEDIPKVRDLGARFWPEILV